VTLELDPSAAPVPPTRARRVRRPRQSGGPVSLLAQGTPFVWLTGGGLVLCLCMVLGLLGLVLYQGFGTFWPGRLVEVQLHDGRVLLGEVTRTEEFRPGPDVLAALSAERRAEVEVALARREGLATRRLLRTGNFEVSGEHFFWVSDFEIVSESRPPEAVLLERLSWGRFQGTPGGYWLDGVEVASEATSARARFEAEHPGVRERWEERRELEMHAMGRLNAHLEHARLALREVELAHGVGSPEHAAEAARVAELERESTLEFEALQARIEALRDANARHELEVVTADGVAKRLPLEEIVRLVPANELGLAGRIEVYLGRWKEFLLDEPREANSEGGVFPAIFGTVVMTLLMTLVVVPIGVLAALYLREYAKSGWIVSAVRIAINNLAGVPSIVFGVFGLGFFCYFIGGGVDGLFYRAKLPTPTFGTGGILWAALTLALLTLPVVIVATEEALAAVPNSMREGSYGCGASKWQTIRRIVLPRALPGITTGMILAMARGAGEVAPLMLVGAVKLAPELPLDSAWPFVHAERSFMHLGFHIYDLGFQSQNSEAAKPMVFTTTLLLIAIIVTLNLAAIAARARLHRRFKGSHI